jgi:hypothetical protein
MAEDIVLDTKALDAFVKSLTGELPKIKIGILGAKDARDDDGSNASIGYKHEFGAEGMPQRSFLRMPLTTQLDSKIESSAEFTESKLREIIRTKSILPWVQTIATLAEQTVLEAFASGGFGKWKKHAKGYENNTGMILVDTTQLRESITSEVV